MLYRLFGRLNYIIFILIFCFSNLLEQQDAQILQVCLDALHNILKQTGEENLEAVVTQIEECGGLDKIENLQTHSNGDIYHQSYEIFEKFFSNEANDEDISSMNQAPALLNSSNEFSFGNLHTNQTVPENNEENNNARFQF
jgi:hypothetical protein